MGKQEIPLDSRQGKKTMESTLFEFSKKPICVKSAEQKPPVKDLLWEAEIPALGMEGWESLSEAPCAEESTGCTATPAIHTFIFLSWSVLVPSPEVVYVPRNKEL